jgi:hypothetical protein
MMFARLAERLTARWMQFGSSTGAFVQPGTVYAFQTLPLGRNSHTPTGRFAAFKVLGANDRVVAVAVLDGIFFKLPSIEELHGLTILKQRFIYKEKYSRPSPPELAVYGIHKRRWKESDLPELITVGSLHVGWKQRRLAEPILRFRTRFPYGGLTAISAAAEGEWQRRNFPQE